MATHQGPAESYSLQKSPYGVTNPRPRHPGAPTPDRASIAGSLASCRALLSVVRVRFRFRVRVRFRVRFRVRVRVRALVRGRAVASV